IFLLLSHLDVLFCVLVHWNYHNVKSVFLFAPLEEEIYIKTPKGSKRKAPFLKLNKSLYGLQQTHKTWNETLTAWFLEIDDNKDSFVFFHVDGMIVMGKMDEFKRLFIDWFTNSSAHEQDMLLGMNLEISPDSISLSQTALIKKGLVMLDMARCNLVKTPLFTGVQLKKARKGTSRIYEARNQLYEIPPHTQLSGWLPLS
ncbi:copia protein, partial [Puccinia sorghi]